MAIRFFVDVRQGNSVKLRKLVKATITEGDSGINSRFAKSLSGHAEILCEVHLVS